MSPFLIVYATREGQTRRIGEHIEATIRDRGHPARLINVRELREPFGFDRYEAVIIAASVHTGKHEREMVAFVKRHREQLEKLPTAFISVSLSEAGVEDPKRPENERTEATADVERMIDDFLVETGWRPNRVKAVAGALRYSKYNFFIRFVMKRIAKKAGMVTDTSRDYELTDWKALDRFVDELLGERAATANAAPPP